MVAERAGHAAAARLYRVDFQAGDELQDTLDRAHHAEGFLVAVSMNQRTLRDRLERQIKSPSGGLAHQEFLEHQRVQRELRCTFALDHRGHFVAEAENAARLKTDHRYAASYERLNRRDDALG